MTNLETLRKELGNIGVLIVESRGDVLLLQGSANRRRASIPASSPVEDAVLEVKRQLQSNSGQWPEEVLA